MQTEPQMPQQQSSLLQTSTLQFGGFIAFILLLSCMYTDGISMMGDDACCQGDRKTDADWENDVKFALAMYNTVCIYSLVKRIMRTEIYTVFRFRWPTVAWYTVRVVDKCRHAYTLHNALELCQVWISFFTDAPQCHTTFILNVWLYSKL